MSCVRIELWSRGVLTIDFQFVLCKRLWKCTMLLCLNWSLFPPWNKLKQLNSVPTNVFKPFLHFCNWRLHSSGRKAKLSIKWNLTLGFQLKWDWVERDFILILMSNQSKGCERQVLNGGLQKKTLGMKGGRYIFIKIWYGFFYTMWVTLLNRSARSVLCTKNLDVYYMLLRVRVSVLMRTCHFV